MSNGERFNTYLTTTTGGILDIAKFNEPVSIRYTGSVNIFSDDDLPEKVCFNKKATVLIWDDGTKTIVKCSNDDEQDPILGYLYAYFEKHSGLSKTKARKYLDDVKKEYEKSINKSK